jgi:Flp pilus assembly protein TadG
MLLMLGVFDFSRAFWSQSNLGHVAREAARFASVRSVISDSPATAETVADYIVSQTTLDPEKLGIDTTWLPTNNPGAVVRVSLTYQFDPILPLVIADTLTLASSSEMTISF